MIGFRRECQAAVQTPCRYGESLLEPRVHAIFHAFLTGLRWRSRLLRIRRRFRIILGLERAMETLLSISDFAT